MTAALLFSLTLQLVSLGLLLIMLKGRFFHFSGSLFVLVAFVYHGLSELLNRLGPSGTERAGLTLSELDRWQWFVGLAIFLFTLSYLLVLKVKETTKVTLASSELKNITTFLDWRILAIITLPMYLYELSGGILSENGLSGKNYLQSGLVTQFLLIFVVFLSFSIILHFGVKVALPVFLVQALSIVLLGERLPVVAVSVALFYSLKRVNLTLSPRQVWTFIILMTLVIAALSVSRITTGRSAYGVNSSGTTRTNALLSGVASLGKIPETFRKQFSNRLDGNDFAAYTLKGITAGIPPVGFTTFKNDAKLEIPSFIFPSKLNMTEADRDEELYFELRYDMPPMNRLPTVFGTFAGYFGPYWLELIAAILGAMFALIDRWLSKFNMYKFVIGIGLIFSIMYYEQGPTVYFAIFRGVIVMLAVITFIQFSRKSTMEKHARLNA